MSTQERHLRVVKPTDDSVDVRLRRAFPEVDFKRIAAQSTVLNEHNLAEKWAATVRSVQFWVELAQ